MNLKIGSDNSISISSVLDDAGNAITDATVKVSIGSLVVDLVLPWDAGRSAYYGQVGDDVAFVQGTIYVLTLEIDKGTDHFEDTYEVIVGDPLSRYLTYKEFRTRWGAENIRVASNKDNSSATDPDLVAVQRALSYADAWLHNLLRGGVYEVPLNFGDEDVDPVVRE